MIRKMVVCVAVLLWGFCTQADATPLYLIKDITPAGYSSAVAYDINSSGDAVGIAESFATGSRVEAYFFYDHAAGTSTVFGLDTVKPRGGIVGASGFARAAINDGGAIVGSAMFVGSAAETRGFIYSGGTSGSFTNLGILAGATPTGIRPASDAMDINSAGTATGTATSGAGTIAQEKDNIDVYTGTAMPITDIDGDISIVTRGDLGRAINNAGLIVGSNQDGRATLFSGASETVFLAGTVLDGVGSTAYDLNEVGQITGDSSLSASYIYDTTDSSLRILPNLGTGGRVFAKAINESGDVVGWGDRSSSLSGQGRGFVHVHDENTSYILEDHIVDLTFPGGTNPGDWERLRTAWGVNDDGWIVGVGDRRFDGSAFPNGRAYLLIPTVIPEPSTAVLLVTACVALVLRAKPRAGQA